jgi:hypothetical protein
MSLPGLAELNEPLMSSTLMMPGDDLPLSDPEDIHHGRARVRRRVLRFEYSLKINRIKPNFAFYVSCAPDILRGQCLI